MAALEDEIQQASFSSPFQKAMVNLIFTGNWIHSEHGAFFKEYGLTVQQFNVLRILRGQHPEPASVSLIIERMLDKMSNASRIVERLRKKGLVERRVCDSDRRQVDVMITKAGLDLLGEMDENTTRFSKPNLAPEEIDQLNLLLDKLRG